MTTATITNDNPRIYVACLASYNASQLHGVWIDAAQNVDDIQNAIDEMLHQSPVPNAEEWAIHDVENFNGIHLDEYENLETVTNLACFIEEHGEAFAFYYEIFGDDNINNFEERYLGCHTSQEEFVYEYLEDTGALESINKAGLQTCYIDFEKITRDWFMTDFISEEGNDGVHVYWNY